MNKYKIKIMGKDKCILYSKEINKKTIIISISDCGHSTKFYSNSNIVDILSLEFDDIEVELNGCILNNLTHCKMIKDFVDKYKNEVSNIIVHCTMGISRSGAVGMTLARYLNGDDNYLWNTGKYIPNKLVYKNMCNVLGLDFSEKEFKKNQKISDKISEKNLKGKFSSYGINLDDMFSLKYD